MKLYLPPEQYEKLKDAETGTPLIEIFPNGILCDLQPNGDVVLHNPDSFHPPVPPSDDMVKVTHALRNARVPGDLPYNPSEERY